MSAIAGRRGGYLLLYGGALLLAVAFGAIVAYAHEFGGDNGSYILAGAFLAVVVAAAILLQWRLGVLLLLATLPYLSIINLGPLASGTKALTLITLLSLAVALFREPELAERFTKLWRQPLTLAVLAFLLWSLTSILWASAQGAAVAKTTSFLGLFALTLIVGLLEKRYLRLLWVVTILSVALSVPAGYILPQSGKMAEVGRFGTGGADPNVFATTLVIIFLVAFFGMRYHRILVYLLAPVLLYGIFATQSRTGFIALVGVPLLAALVPGSGLRMGGRTLLLYALGGAALVTVTLLSPSFGGILSDRYETITQYQDESTWSGRWSIWQGAFQVIASNPVLGVGAGNFGEAALNYSTYIFKKSSEAGAATGVAHNMFLSVTSELGIVGLVLFLGLLFFAFKAALQVCKSSTLGAGLLLGLVAYLIAGMSLTAETDKIVYVLYGSIISIMLQQDPQHFQENEREEDL